MIDQLVSICRKAICQCRKLACLLVCNGDFREKQDGIAQISIRPAMIGSGSID